jgi:hypothetical protein
MSKNCIMKRKPRKARAPLSHRAGRRADFVTVLFAAAALAATACAVPGMAATPCHAAIDRAAAATGAPRDLLTAIAMAESGRNGAPWPWALNVAGRGYWHPDRDALAAHVRALVEAGETRFDVGCFQINARWHGQEFPNIDAMLDPNENALYAARFLAALRVELGTWEGATGAYHSRTPALAEAYRARVARHRAAARPRAPTDTAPRAEGAAGPLPVPVEYPLLRGGVSGAPGSVVPALAARAPFLAGWAAR